MDEGMISSISISEKFKKKDYSYYKKHYNEYYIFLVLG